MKTRGEKSYINMPIFAARLYDNLTNIRGINKGFEDIAVFLSNFLKQGNLLDIGTGPGRLLYKINEKNPDIFLFGLDISASMLDVARKNLHHIKNVDLRIGNIVKTEYQSDYFDCIVSTGSFYNWDKPVEGLNEIYRILKPGKTAYIFETTKDHDKKLLVSRLKSNLKSYNLIRKFLSKFFLKKQLRMTYTVREFNEIIVQSEFKNSYNIEQTELGNLPIYVRLELKKQQMGI
jgi:ubiquinone/menaquinone biosynthesis C-methylase UbiE